MCVCRHAIQYSPLNLETLQTFADLGRLDTGHVITMKQLRDSGAVRPKIEHGIKLLAKVRSGGMRPEEHCRIMQSDSRLSNCEGRPGTHQCAKYFEAFATWQI